MRRFFRIVFNTLTVLSLVLAMGVAGLWVRSSSTGMEVSRKSRSGLWIFQAGSGVGGFYSLRFTDGNSHYEKQWPDDFDIKIEATPLPVEWVDYLVSGSPPLVFRQGEFRYASKSGPEQTEYFLSIPCWACVLIFSVAPTAFALSSFRKRAQRGRCPTCNYDLRATPDRCPECGAVPEGATV